MDLMRAVAELFDRRVTTNESGTVGWLAVGVILGALLAIGLIIKLLIPGD